MLVSISNLKVDVTFVNFDHLISNSIKFEYHIIIFIKETFFSLFFSPIPLYFVDLDLLHNITEILAIET